MPRSSLRPFNVTERNGNQNAPCNNIFSLDNRWNLFRVTTSRQLWVVRPSCSEHNLHHALFDIIMWPQSRVCCLPFPRRDLEAVGTSRRLSNIVTWDSSYCSPPRRAGRGEKVYVWIGPGDNMWAASRPPNPIPPFAKMIYSFFCRRVQVH